MGMAKSKTTAREFENFLRNIVKDMPKGREFVAEACDGSQIKMKLVAPHAADANRACILVDKILDHKRLNGDVPSADFSKLVRLACVTCIKGVTYENVMAVLRAFPTPPPMFSECLRLLGLSDDQMHDIGVKPNVER